MEKKEKTQKLITPSQYFDYLKGAKNTITTEALRKSYGAFIQLGKKYQELGQVESLKKLCFLADTLLKEEKLIELGITTFVYKDTIEDYITNVADKAVKIIELSRYMREVPDELVDTIKKSKEIFDELYVVFTDYTGVEERKVNKERRDKDPILFGVFKSNTNVADRFYFLGDWVDEHCDLTLDKLVEQYTATQGKTPVVETQIPQNTEELVAILQTYKVDEKAVESVVRLDGEADNSLPVRGYSVDTRVESTPGFFKRIRSIFKK